MTSVFGPNVTRVVTDHTVVVRQSKISPDGIGHGSHGTGRLTYMDSI